MRFRAAPAFAAVAACALLSACSIDVDGARAPDLDASAGNAPSRDAARPPPPPYDAWVAPPPDAEPPPPSDAGVDAPPPPPVDAGDCVFCNGQCVTSCNGCSAGQALCAATRTCGDCSDCTGENGAPRPIQCFECDGNRENPIGTCEPDDRTAYCLSGTLHATMKHCGCANAACPGSTDVCMDIGGGVMACVTCGEGQAAGWQVSTDNQPCQGGGKCHANGQQPECK